MKILFFTTTACHVIVILVFTALFCACSSGNSSNSDAVDSSGSEEEVTTETVSMIDGHEYVDLGLSVKWATMNVGAVSPSDYGYFFAWGEIQPKEIFTPQNSRTYKKGINVIAQKPQYDAACANWGDPWRLPSRDEYLELMRNCTKEWTEVEDTPGYLLTSKINGNTVFFPAAGMYDESGYKNGNSGGYYTTSTTMNSESRLNVRFWELDDYFGFGGYPRYWGLSVRAVTK